MSVHDPSVFNMVHAVYPGWYPLYFGLKKPNCSYCINNSVLFVLAYVIKKYLAVNDVTVKAIMAQKCKDLRKSMESSRKTQEDDGNR